MGKGKVPLAAAQLIADWLVRELAPHCERIEVAGSIRRGKAEVGDIELLYIPRPERVGQATLFGDVAYEDPVDRHVRGMMERGVLEKRLNSAGHPIGYGDRNKALLHVASGVGVDLFSTDEQNWGMAMVVRTGPAEWNEAMMAAFLRKGMRGHAYGGVTGRNGEQIDCPTEESVFDLLGMRYLEPHERTPDMLRSLAR